MWESESRVTMASNLLTSFLLGRIYDSASIPFSYACFPSFSPAPEHDGSFEDALICPLGFSFSRGHDACLHSDIKKEQGGIWVPISLCDYNTSYLGGVVRRKTKMAIIFQILAIIIYSRIQAHPELIASNVPFSKKGIISSWTSESHQRTSPFQHLDFSSEFPFLVNAFHKKFFLNMAEWQWQALGILDLACYPHFF